VSKRPTESGSTVKSKLLILPDDPVDAIEAIRAYCDSPEWSDSQARLLAVKIVVAIDERGNVPGVNQESDGN
jgi:hypothetical protein